MFANPTASGNTSSVHPAGRQAGAAPMQGSVLPTGSAQQGGEPQKY